MCSKKESIEERSIEQAEELEQLASFVDGTIIESRPSNQPALESCTPQPKNWIAIPLSESLVRLGLTRTNQAQARELAEQVIASHYHLGFEGQAPFSGRGSWVADIVKNTINERKGYVFGKQDALIKLLGPVTMALTQLTAKKELPGSNFLYDLASLIQQMSPNIDWYMRPGLEESQALYEHYHQLFVKSATGNPQSCHLGVTPSGYRYFSFPLGNFYQRLNLVLPYTTIKITKKGEWEEVVVDDPQADQRKNRDRRQDAAQVELGFWESGFNGLKGINSDLYIFFEPENLKTLLKRSRPLFANLITPYWDRGMVDLARCLRFNGIHSFGSLFEAASDNWWLPRRVCAHSLDDCAKINDFFADYALDETSSDKEIHRHEVIANFLPALFLNYRSLFIALLSLPAVDKFLPHFSIARLKEDLGLIHPLMRLLGRKEGMIDELIDFMFENRILTEDLKAKINNLTAQSASIINEINWEQINQEWLKSGGKWRTTKLETILALLYMFEI